ncbi:MAG TPA: hypothetical protein VJL61_03160 [Rhodanobacteraceae bacterium]|nr:hypothetical protein [Rhodanobacteraceae bacterium]
MRGTFSSRAWGCLARAAALGTGALALAGCATGYAFVQPDVAGGGGYYTSDAPYSGQGYYDYYGTGPYYPGTSGYGYYNGTSPYSNPFGWYGGYGDYGYWPSFTFNLGISNVWNFPGYWGPWYSTGWGCARWDCGHHGRHHHHDRNPVASDSPRPWLKPDHPPVPPSSRVSGLSVPAPARSMERFANRRPLPSARFAPHDFARGPAGRIRNPALATPTPAMATPRVPVETESANRRPLAGPVRPDFRAPLPMVPRPATRLATEPEFVNRRPMAMPARSDFRAPAPVSRPAPMVSRPVPAVTPARPVPSGRAAATKVEIP